MHSGKKAISDNNVSHVDVFELMAIDKRLFVLFFVVVVKLLTCINLPFFT